VPYRIDLRDAVDATSDRLIELGALDLEISDDGGIAALMPDSVTTEQLGRALGNTPIAISTAIARDAGSVWVLRPRSTQAGCIRIDPRTKQPSLTQRVAHHGRLVLSGIPRSVEQDVVHAYRRLGMHLRNTKQREGWIALILQASW
jgi:hypothetical protein